MVVWFNFPLHERVREIKVGCICLSVIGCLQIASSLAPIKQFIQWNNKIYPMIWVQYWFNAVCDKTDIWKPSEIQRKQKHLILCDFLCFNCEKNCLCSSKATKIVFVKWINCEVHCVEGKYTQMFSVWMFENVSIFIARLI